MELTRNKVIEIRALIEKALKDAKIEGVDINVLGGRYTDTKLTMKIEAVTDGEEAKAEEEAEANLKYGITIHHIKQTENDEWKLVDYHSKKSKYPFIAIKKDNDKRYKLSPEQVKHKMCNAVESEGKALGDFL